MKLLDAEIPLEKLIEYCLNPDHPEGRHKARVFQRALGIDQNRANDLHDLLRAAISNEEAEFIFEDRFGKYYRIDYQVEGLRGAEILRSYWIMPVGRKLARLVTCFVRGRKE